jgi:vacuolar-type H+-ATPase subunit C/Vma6
LSLSDGFRGLTEIADAEGLRGVEQQLTNTYLVHTVHAKLHPLVRDFFIRIIDARNIISLYKYLRMNMTAALTFIPGGTIPDTRLRDILDKKDLLRIGSLIREITGTKMEILGAAPVENVLYKEITRFLKKAGRDPLGVGLILDYLWRCSLEAMNLGLLFYGKDLERDAIAAELVH